MAQQYKIPGFNPQHTHEKIEWLFKKWCFDDLKVTQKLKYRVTYDLQIPLLEPKMIENICPHKILCMCAHSSIIQKSQKVKTSQISIN